MKRSCVLDPAAHPTLDDSSDRRTADTPILVVGGGPAGSVTALLLARRGWSVELVDRATFPRPKACGECVNPGGVLLLRKLGLLERVLAEDPVPLQGWDLVLPESGMAARGRFRPPDRALGVERRTFDHALLSAARDIGVIVREGVRAVEVRPGSAHEPAAVKLVTDGRDPEIRTARVLIGADGLRSRVAAELGITSPQRHPNKASLTWRIRGRGPEPDRGLLVLGDGLTAGLAPVPHRGSGRWNATLVAGDPARRSSLAREGWPLLIHLFRQAEIPWRAPPAPEGGPWGSGSFHRPVGSAVAGRTLLVGDAAGYFDPLTGQGIYRALRTARLAADLISGKLAWPGSHRPHGEDVALLALHHRRMSRALAPGRMLQHGIEAVLSRSLPRRACLTALGHLPAVTSGLIRITGNRAGTLVPRAHRAESTFLGEDAVDTISPADALPPGR